MYRNLNYFNARTSYEQAAERNPVFSGNKLEPSLNNILHSVHHKLKYNPKPAVPRIPKPIAETMPSNRAQVFLVEGGDRTHRQRGGHNARDTITRLQADLEQKQMQHSRRLAGTTQTMSFNERKRYREVLHQKRLLENMLKEHHRLQNDRDSIASEINYMRSYLDNIRNKLDVSLRKLNSQKTFAQTCAPRKVMQQAAPLRVSRERKAVSKPNVVKNATRGVNRIAGGYSRPNMTSISKPASSRVAMTFKCPKVRPNRLGKKKVPQRWAYATQIKRNYEIKGF